MMDPIEPEGWRIGNQWTKPPTRAFADVCKVHDACFYVRVDSWNFTSLVDAERARRSMVWALEGVDLVTELRSENQTLQSENIQLKSRICALEAEVARLRLQGDRT